MKLKVLKKAISILLVLCMMLALMPMSVVAVTKEYTFDVGMQTQNAEAVTALINSAAGDRITLTGAGTVTLPGNSTVAGGVQFEPGVSGIITLEGGGSTFTGPIDVLGDITSGTVLKNAKINQTDPATNAINIHGGSLSLENGTVVTSERDGISVSVEADDIVIASGAAITAQRYGIIVNGGSKADRIIVGGTVSGLGASGIAGPFQADGKIAEVTVKNSGAVTGENAGIWLENGEITNFNIENGGAVSGNGYGIYLGGGSKTISLLLAGRLEAPQGSALFNAGKIFNDFTIESTGIVKGAKYGVRNVYIDDAFYGQINMLYVLGKVENTSSAADTAAIANAGGQIHQLAVGEGGAVTGGYYGILNGKTATPASIDELYLVKGSITGGTNSIFNDVGNSSTIGKIDLEGNSRFLWGKTSIGKIGGVDYTEIEPVTTITSGTLIFGGVPTPISARLTESVDGTPIEGVKLGLYRQDGTVVAEPVDTNASGTVNFGLQTLVSGQTYEIRSSADRTFDEVKKLYSSSKVTLSAADSDYTINSTTEGLWSNVLPELDGYPTLLLNDGDTLAINKAGGPVNISKIRIPAGANATINGGGHTLSHIQVEINDNASLTIRDFKLDVQSPGFLAFYGRGSNTVTLAGDNFITGGKGESVDMGASVAMRGENLTFAGEGSLTVTGDNYGTGSPALLGFNINITGPVHLTAKGGDTDGTYIYGSGGDGIAVANALTVSANATITATGGNCSVEHSGSYGGNGISGKVIMTSPAAAFVTARGGSGIEQSGVGHNGIDIMGAVTIDNSSLNAASFTFGSTNYNNLVRNSNYIRVYRVDVTAAPNADIEVYAADDAGYTTPLYRARVDSAGKAYIFLPETAYKVKAGAQTSDVAAFTPTGTDADQGARTVTLGASPIVSATLSPATVTFDKNPANQADVSTTIKWNDAVSVTDVKKAGMSVGAAVYAVSGNTLTIKKEYLAVQPVGSLVLTVEFDKGNAATLAIGISNTTTPTGSNPPTWPAGSMLTASGTTKTGTTLSWTPAQDDLGVTAYSLYGNGSVLYETVTGAVYKETVTEAVYSLDISGLLPSTTYTFQVKAGDADNNWTDGPTATVRTHSSGGGARSGGSGGSGRSSTPAPEPKPVAQVLDSNGNISKTIAIKLDNSTGNATVEVDAASLAGAFEKSKADGKGVKTVKVDIPKIEGAKAYEPVLPASFLASGDATKAVEIKTYLAAVTMPGNMLPAANAAGAQKVSLTIAAGDKSKLAADVQAQIGIRPVIELNLKIDGKQTSWSNKSAPVTVTVPYTPTADEMKDPEHITVWYIDGSGKAVSVPSGRYDPATGKVTFSITHFSKYAVTWVYKTFNDISYYAWAKKPIEVLVSKGIINGTSDSTFSPAANITRADYLVLLVKTLGLTADFDGNFDDVQPGTYYYEAVGIAKKLGIAAGSGNNRFNPKENISRQDMMVLTVRALEKYKGLKAANDNAVLDKFKDKADIAAYAVESLATLVGEGLIAGFGDIINPRSNTTRAEAAVFLYRIYNSFKIA